MAEHVDEKIGERSRARDPELTPLDARTREEWRELSLQWVCIPWVRGPRLAFDAPTWRDQFTLKEVSAETELQAIFEAGRKYKKSADGAARTKLAREIRRRWRALVDHAI